MSRVCLLLPDWTRCVASEVVARGSLSEWCARADRLEPGAGGFAAAVREVLPWGGSPLPAAALSRQIDVGDAADSAWLRADPAYVRADMVTARMLACGELGLTDEESAGLARELMPLFGDAGFELDARFSNRWYLRAAIGSDLPACASPDEAMGDDLKLHLPQGAAGKRWRQLFNDSQIILHNHPVNAQRAARGAVSVNSLWFWGAGVLPVSVRGGFERIFSDGLELRGLAQIAGIPRQSLELKSLQAQLSESGNGDLLIDLTGLRNDLLESSLRTIDNALRRGHVRGADLLFASGQRYRLQSLHRLRFWRRISELRC
ncbi:MAG TPA: phosphoglycerate mutase [Dokdonella sp.]|uniref:phosphoglycerate mutase n=1 Tax=Dokdonella sp. TaxID=2291710 RepID=UPI002D7E98DE|nr:phosphoglycerate mutase [Dokdonella sp.]HET9032765.1 phosphoglycerate mutase [Dokdonella sp.]